MSTLPKYRPVAVRSWTSEFFELEERVDLNRDITTYQITLLVDDPEYPHKIRYTLPEWEGPLTGFPDWLQGPGPSVLARILREYAT